MFVVENLGAAILFCVITMLGWGSWANTQKLARKDRWPFPLYYWDYAIGVFLLSLIFLFILGGSGQLSNLGQAGTGPVIRAILSGVLFNIANIMLVVAIDAAGMAVAFPVGVGLALVIGTIATYAQTPKGNPASLFVGVVFVIAAMLMSGLAHSRLPRKAGAGWARGVVFAVIAGCLMGFFYPQLVQSISPDFVTKPIEPGYLSPYSALVLFALGLLASNFVVNTIFMKTANLSYQEYFNGSLKLHSLGALGGMIWMLALTFNLIASGVAGPAISYALGQGATLVAAIWGVFVWKEFRQAPKGTLPFVVLMLVGYTAGLLMIGLATL